MDISAERRDLSEYTSTEVPDPQQLVDCLERDGYCIVSGLHDVVAMQSVVGQLGDIVHHRDSSADGITYLRAHNDYGDRAGFAGFSAEALPPHTDRSSLVQPPRLVAMAWKTAACAGGDLAIHDFARILPILRRDHPAIVALLAEGARVRYADGDSEYCGPMLQRLESGRYQLRFRVDKNGFYRFSDSPLVSMLVSELYRYQQPVRLSGNDVIVLDNHRCLHSRTHYTGQREVLRLLAETDLLQPGFAEAYDAV